MSDREQTTAELLLQVQALEGVADRLESEGVYERKMVRAAASRISRLALDLNDLAAEGEGAVRRTAPGDPDDVQAIRATVAEWLEHHAPRIVSGDYMEDLPD